jgi:hypothetical protein
MNPDVTNNITLFMSELQQQFLQHLKIQPLQTHIPAPAYQHTVPEAVASPIPESVTVIDSQAPAWLPADISQPLVQDLLICLQQYDVVPQWFYQAQAEEILLTGSGLYSAPPQRFFTAEQKKQLWHSLSAQFSAEILTDTDPT